MGVAACLRWEPIIRMAKLTTTHRHDYRWPNADCVVPKAEATNGSCEARRQDNPWCGHDPTPLQPRTEPRTCYDLVHTPVDRPWCQQGPLVPRVNPNVMVAPSRLRSVPKGCKEVQPADAKPWCQGDIESRTVLARVGAAPQQDTSRYNQPNQYLQKLCDKYPRPTAVVTATPREELMRRIYADRYRTTYQTDFCQNADDIARQTYEKDMFDAQNYVAELQPAVEYVYCKCGCGCRVVKSQQSAGDALPRLRPIACRPAAVSHNVHFSCCTPKKKINHAVEEVGPPEKIPPWVSEYTDNISRTGQLIMDQKLLRRKIKH